MESTLCAPVILEEFVGGGDRDEVAEPNDEKKGREESKWSGLQFE